MVVVVAHGVVVLMLVVGVDEREGYVDVCVGVRKCGGEVDHEKRMWC